MPQNFRQFLFLRLPMIALMWNLGISWANTYQSEKCTDQELIDRTQCLRRLPDKEYSFPLGYTALLPCEIANQHGKAQWSANEILLGHDRSIPGHERYSMPGSVESGDVSLQIQNLTISDVGQYECQVAPVPSGNHPLLRRKTHLEVTVMPSMPRLRSSSRGSDGRLIVSLPELSATMAVQCEARGGNPPPDFFWKLNDFVLESARPPAHWPQIMTESNSGFSNITLEKSTLKTGDQLVCEVSNKATNARQDTSARTLKTAATIEVQYAPGPPKIIFSDAHFDGNIPEGSKLTAMCSATPPGNPVGSIFWRWRFPPKPAHTHRATRTPFTSFDMHDFEDIIGHKEDVPSSFYAVYKMQDQLSSKLVIPTVDRRFHCANLSCETAHSTGEALRTEQTIKVHFHPRNLTVQLRGTTLSNGMVAGREEAVAYAKEGASLTFICTTDEMFPDVNLKWVLLTEDRSIFRSDLQPASNQRKQSTVKAGAYTRESRITIQMLRQYHRGFLDCQAWFEGTNRIMRSVQLGIMHPPDTPVIKGIHSAEALHESESRRLTCESMRGHPPPILKWFKGGKLIISTFQQHSFRDGVSLEIELVVTSEDNRANLWCEAVSKGLTASVRSELIILNVYYPPASVDLRTNLTGAVFEGGGIEISCEAGPSNPPAHLQWRYYHCSDVKLYMGRAEHSTIQLIDAPNSRLFMQTRPEYEMNPKDCRTDERAGIVDPPETAANGGLISHGRLILQPKWSDHNDFVACFAANSEYGPQTKETKFALNVSFAPRFVGYKPWASYTINEGGSGTLDLIPYGNPPVTSITWFAGSNPLKKSPVNIINDDLKKTSVKQKLKTMNDGLYQLNELLTIWSVKRSHRKNITISATNDVGTNNETFVLNITFPAKVKTVQDANVSMASTAQLNCTAEGNPAVAVRHVAWRRIIFPNWDTEAQNALKIGTESIGCSEVVRKDDAIKLVVRCEDIGQFMMTSQLLIYNVGPGDVGLYECVVNNGIVAAHTKEVQLFSPFPPTVLRQPKFEKVAASFGTGVTLRCFINTEPLPNVDWYLTGRDADGNAVVQYILDSQCDIFVPKPNSACSPKPPPSKLKFTQSLKRIRPGHHVASLSINRVHVTDFGMYMCKVSSITGEPTSLTIQLTGVGPPEIPYKPECLGSTTTAVKIAWGQGFNGGYDQTFRVRWRPVQSGEQYMYADIREEDHGAPMAYTIVGLKPSTQYEVSANSRNDPHGQTNYTTTIFCWTNSTFNEQELFGGYYNIQSAGYANSNSLFIIVSACVIGGLVIIINIVVIAYLMRKRRKNNAQFATDQGYNLEKCGRSAFKTEMPHYHQPGQCGSSPIYAPDPMFIPASVAAPPGTPVQLNQFYGYLPTEESENQSAVGPRAATATLSPAAESTYRIQPLLDGCLYDSTRVRGGSRRTMVSPAFVADGYHGYRQLPMPCEHVCSQANRFTRSQSFSDILNDGRPLLPPAWTCQQGQHLTNTIVRQPSKRRHTRSRSIGIQRAVPKSPPLQMHDYDDEILTRRRVSFSDLAHGHNDYIGYAEDSYVDQLEALQSGDSPTKRILLNNCSETCQTNTTRGIGRHRSGSRV